MNTLLSKETEIYNKCLLKHCKSENEKSKKKVIGLFKDIKNNLVDFKNDKIKKIPVFTDKVFAIIIKFLKSSNQSLMNCAFKNCEKEYKQMFSQFMINEGLINKTIKTYIEDKDKIIKTFGKDITDELKTLHNIFKILITRNINAKEYSQLKKIIISLIEMVYNHNKIKIQMALFFLKKNGKLDTLIPIFDSTLEKLSK